MNYRHAYHAGGFSDVVKHAVLALALSHLRRKDTPFLALDTHAGVGRYDLAGPQAEKTGEWQGGIGRVLASPAPPPALGPYLDVVRRLNPDGGMRWYPGSPELARTLLRPGDRLSLVELHPEDVAELKRLFAGDRQVGIHHMDGYVALKALLPPPERRGLVLIDPPFEVKDEVERLRAGLGRTLKRWPTGIYLIWYPIKARAAIERFHADIAMLAPPPTLAAELLLRPADDPFRLNGTGMLIVNPPWQLDQALAELLPWLAANLAPDSGTWRIDWLTGKPA